MRFLYILDISSAVVVLQLSAEVLRSVIDRCPLDKRDISIPPSELNNNSNLKRVGNCSMIILVNVQECSLNSSCRQHSSV